FSLRSSYFHPSSSVPGVPPWNRPGSIQIGTAAGNYRTSMIEMKDLIAKSLRDCKEGSIVKGRVLEIRPREVLVDIGYKSEGVISASEFDDIDELQVGDEVEVLLVRLENE